jgi:hypothetical protein
MNQHRIPRLLEARGQKHRVGQLNNSSSSQSTPLGIGAEARYGY